MIMPDLSPLSDGTTREHAVTTVVRLRAMRYALWMREVWSGEPDAAHPAAIQHEEVDRVLADPAESSRAEARFYAEDPAAVALTARIDEAATHLAADARWKRLSDVFDLTANEQQLFSLAVALSCDPSIGRAFAYLHDQPEMTYATPLLAARLYGPGVAAMPVVADMALARWRFVTRVPEVPAAQGVWLGWVADPLLVAWLQHGDDHDVPVGAELTPPHAFSTLPVLYPAELRSASELVASAQGEPHQIEFIGVEGSGRRVLASQIASGFEKPLLTVAEDQLLDSIADGERVATALAAVRSSRLHDAIPYWREGRDAAVDVRRMLLARARNLIAGRHAASADPHRADVVFGSFELPPLTRADRERLWASFSDRPVPQQVRDWLLTPAEIQHLARGERGGTAARRHAYRRPSDSLSLLLKLPLPFEPGDLVLPPALQRAVDDFENQVRFRWDVYEDWGFSRLCPNGRGVIALFAGPSGTGKTMTAQVLARKLGLELYRLDPAQVVNKYIGETEKRLKLIFDEGDRAHFMLLVDECDGMFGQRFASRDAHDRYANLEIDYLLQRLERFQGVAVLSTNRKTDLDAAFQRRIRFVIDFLPPGPAERLRLWQQALPEKSPSGEPITDPLDLDTLAERVSLTGAEITLAALNAAFLARAADSKIAMSHVLDAVRRELAKKGQTLRGFE